MHRICLYPVVLLLLLHAGYVLAHAQMASPFPIRSPLDPLTPEEDKDYSYTSPLLADGSNFPCKGYHHDRPIRTTAIYTPGSTYDMKITGGTNHGGGSCQISLSVDDGATFHVIESIIGGCPYSTNATYNFTVPDNTPSGTALLAWTWFNYIGNREMYMNCAEVQIEGTNDHNGLSQLPQIWVANLLGVNSCHTVSTVGGSEQEDAPVFPQPGPEYFFGPAGPDVSAGGLKNSSSPPSPECGQGYPKNTDTVLNTGPEDQLGKAESQNTASLSSTLTAQASSSLIIATSSSTTQVVFQPSANPSTFLTLTSASSVASTTTIPFKTSTRSGAGQISLAQPSNLPFGSESDLNPFFPCNPNTFLCTSASKYVQCVRSDSYGPEGLVPAGLMCVPYSAMRTYQTLEGTVSGGGPEGTYRDDRFVPASTLGSCNIAGATLCLRAGRGFALCDNGTWRDMGDVAAGTTCQDNGINVDS